LRVQDSRYGNGIPLVFGCARVAGNVIWASNLIETSHESSTGSGKGGVIGGSFSGGSRTTYTYSLHCAAAICSGDIGGIATIWADSKIIYQNGVWKSGVVGNATFYNGTATQSVDPLMESMIGGGQVPAYRGLAYVVLESLQLGNFGNRLPNLTFEVLPATTVTQPKWLGVNGSAAIHHRVFALQNKGMPPIITEGTSLRARKVLVGGYVPLGSTASFHVVEYDVTGNEPVETYRAQSESFAIVSVGDHSWAMAPDGRFVAFYLQTSSSLPPHRFAIYDADTHTFGDVYSTSLNLTDGSKQIAWLDAQHFVVTATSGGKRGVHVFARAGTGIVDLGFFDVWGPNTASAFVPLMYTQFIPMAGGLLNLMADASPHFTAIYARHIAWQNNAVVPGEPYTVASGINTGTGSGPQCSLLCTGEGEWTLFYGTVVDMRMMSFRPGIASAIVSRPWQQLVNTSFSVTTSNHPVVIGNRIVVAQRSSTDNYYRLSEIALLDESFQLVTDGAIVADFAQPLQNFSAFAVDGSRLLLTGVSGFYDTLTQVGIIRWCNTGDNLANVVAALLSRAGYASGDYDVSALADVAVDGYVVADTVSAAGAIEPLQHYEAFDLVESDGRLKAVKHGHDPVLTVPSTETRASDKLEDELLPSLDVVRAQELDLPLEIRVDYVDASTDYETGSRRARRMATRGARSKAKIELPIVCTAARAKQIAEARLFAMWSERERVRVRWSRRWLAVEPGDVVAMDGRLMRVQRVRHEKGLLDVRGVFVPSSPVTSVAETDVASSAGEKLKTAVDSVLYLMDLPLLRSSDDQPGVYAAVSGNSGWGGATLWRSPDGVSYSSLASFQNPATAGIATTPLAPSPCWYMDRASVVNVQLLQGTLSSCSEADLLNGANAALLGDEIIQFQTAALLGPGLYALGHLLRGRRGTEGSTATHIAGERFVVLAENAVQFLPALLTDRGGAYFFRALSNGQALGDATDLGFTYALTTLQPLAPVHLEGRRSEGTGSDLTLSWKRRARKSADWIDNVDVALDEPEEIYDVEIVDGENIVRTYSHVTGTSLTYTAAEQSADWGENVPSPFFVNVYQLSPHYGRGQKASAVI
jgi:hypothetical protein